MNLLLRAHSLLKKGTPEDGALGIRAVGMVESTLKAMAKGGIYDHLIGGFARYKSVIHSIAADTFLAGIASLLMMSSFWSCVGVLAGEGFAWQPCRLSCMLCFLPLLSLRLSLFLYLYLAGWRNPVKKPRPVEIEVDKTRFCRRQDAFAPHLYFEL